MPYYLEGMNIVEGQDTGDNTDAADAATAAAAAADAATAAAAAAAAAAGGKCCGGGECDKMENELNCGEGAGCTWNSEGECVDLSDGKCCGGGECDRMDELNCGEGAGCTWSSGGECDYEPKEGGSLSDILNKLNTELSASFTTVLTDQIKNMNTNTSNKLYDENSKSTEYIRNIKNMSFIDLGDPKNTGELDFIENIILNFLDIPDSSLKGIFKEGSIYCEDDLNINILLTLAIFYNKNRTDFDNIRDNNLIKVDRILNRLSRYFPDVFQKILTGMKMCPGSDNKYMVLENIYKTMFKFNNTTVNLGIMDSVSSIFQNLKGMRTIEMIVIVMAIAFVVSKIFDMFRVKVEV